MKRKTILMMRLACLLGVWLAVSATVSAKAQRNVVTLEVRSESLSHVLMQVKDQTGAQILYNESMLKDVQCENVQLKGLSVEKALEQLLQGTSFHYSVENGVFVIRERQQPQETVKLTGKVTDEKGNPLPGVTVMIKGTGMGVVTDAEGNYTLELPETKDIRLLFSFIGMETKEVAYAGQKEVNVTLKEKAEQMDEVVVTGYQVVDRRKNTSSVQTVKVDDIMIPSATSIDQMLEGRVTDMMLMSNSGEVGVAPKIRIRGTSTLVGNREPLWVVDGIIVQDPVPVSAEELNDPDYVNRIGNAIAGLNPQDIERLDILKDAAATALYGTKAANGVIVITTKKGHVGAPIINYNMTTTFRQRPSYTDRKIDLMNSRERIQFSRELNASHYVFDGNINYVGYEGLLNKLYTHEINDAQFAEQVAQLETLNTDWFDLLTENSWSHQHTLSMSGGSDKTRYYASIGYSRDNDVIKGNHTQRYTAALNLESTLTKWLTASFQMQGNVSRREYSQDGLAPMDYAYNTARTIPVYDENNEYAYFSKKSPYNSSRYNYNILEELENSYKQQHTSALTVTTNLKFNFTNWLNANAIVSYNTSNANIEGYWGEKTWHVACLRKSNYGVVAPSDSGLPFGGELSNNETRNQSYTVRLQLNANKYFGADEQHNINASAGYEMSSTRYNGISTVHRGYYLDRGKSFVSNVDLTDYTEYGRWMAGNVPAITDNLTNIVSGYATLSYSYQNYFTLNVNGRVDGSNKFGSRSNDKFLPIWSASGSYNFSEHEALYADWIDLMSLKVSYGFQGNMLDESPVLTITKLPMDSYTGEMEAEMKQYPNPNLKWEKTGSFNTGLNLSFLKSRVQLQAEYYYKRTKDAFMTKEVASINGVDSYTINGGDVENQGYSFDLTVMPVKTKDWIWTISTSFSKNYNKVMNDPNAQTYDYTSFLNGTAVVKDKAVNTFYSYKFLGLSPVDGGPLFDDMEFQKHELMGLDKYSTFTRVLTPSGRREPSMSGGLSTNLRYKNIRMSAMFTYSLGAKTRLFRMFDKDLGPENNVHRDFLKRWQRPGDEKHTNIPSLLSYASSAYWKYYQHYSTLEREDTEDGKIQRFATDAWMMYDFSDARVVSANYLKCSSLSFTYEFGERILSKSRLQRLALSLSGTNLFTVCSKKLKGQTPTQGGFSEIQLSDRPTYSFGLSVSF